MLYDCDPLLQGPLAIPHVFNRAKISLGTMYTPSKHIKHPVQHTRVHTYYQGPKSHDLPLAYQPAFPSPCSLDSYFSNTNFSREALRIRAYEFTVKTPILAIKTKCLTRQTIATHASIYSSTVHAHDLVSHLVGNVTPCLPIETHTAGRRIFHFQGTVDAEAT